MEMRRLATFYFQCSKTKFDFVLSLILGHAVMWAHLVPITQVLIRDLGRVTIFRSGRILSCCRRSGLIPRWI